MLEVINAALSFPTIVYTVMLGFAIVFWSAVLLGGTDPDALDFHGDVDGDIHVDGDHHMDVPHGGGGWLSSILGFLNIGSVPVSLIGTASIFLSWLACMIGEIYVKPVLAPGVAIWIASVGQMFCSALLGLFVAAMLTRPLRGVFKIHTVHGEGALVDQVCIVVTSQVTKDFGQAEVPTKGAPLLLDVRCNRANQLKKGSKAVIIAHDKDKDVYEIGELEPERSALRDAP